MYMQQVRNIDIIISVTNSQVLSDVFVLQVVHLILLYVLLNYEFKLFDLLRKKN